MISSSSASIHRRQECVGIMLQLIVVAVAGQCHYVKSVLVAELLLSQIYVCPANHLISFAIVHCLYRILTSCHARLHFHKYQSALFLKYQVYLQVISYPVVALSDNIRPLSVRLPLPTPCSDVLKLYAGLYPYCCVWQILL